MLKTARIVPYTPITNVARARKFYEERLGLKPKEKYAGGVIYECGGGSWVIITRQLARIRQRRAPHSADGRVATVAIRPREKLVQQTSKRTNLTPTGLLMEGDYTHGRFLPQTYEHSQ